MKLNSIYSKEHYKTIKLVFDEHGYCIIPEEFYDSGRRSEKEIEYSRTCSNAQGYIFSYSLDLSYSDTFRYIFPSLGDLVNYIQYYFIKQYGIHHEAEITNSEDIKNFILSEKYLKIMNRIDEIIEESETEEKLLNSIGNEIATKMNFPKCPFSISSIQSYIEEIFEDDPIGDTNLHGIFYKENDIWECKQWDKFESFVHGFDEFERPKKNRSKN